MITGKIGQDLGTDEALEAARLCTMNLLATIKGVCFVELLAVTVHLSRSTVGGMDEG